MEQQIVKVKNKKGVRVIPGFGLSMGVTLAMLGCLVLIPLASIFLSASQLSWGEFVEVVTSRQVVSGYVVSLSCAFFAALINAVFGIVLAWVLVRYDFPGKRLMDGSVPSLTRWGSRSHIPASGSPSPWCSWGSRLWCGRSSQCWRNWTGSTRRLR